MIHSWREFFEKRQKRNERLKERETPRQRQLREAREKNPPDTNTKVFVWRKDEKGEYRRESFYRAENAKTIGDFGENQKFYDAFSNEWDCCYEFGLPSDNDVDDADIDEDYIPPDLPLTIAPTSASDSDRSFRVPRPANISFDWQDFETSKLLYDFYGFVPPLPLPAEPSTIVEWQRNLLSTVVGLTRNDEEFYSSPVASFALEFLVSISDAPPKTPKNSSWDIASGNRVSIVGSEIFRRMDVIEDGEKKWYVFDFKEAATVPWKVALCNAVDALYVCRLDRTGGLGITDFEVARELLYHGIQFSTLLPVKPLPLLVTPPITIPVRLFGYKFTEDDYNAYVQQRAALLSNPRVARAALLRGGIVWRLAVATLSFDDVLQGPTTAATLQRQGIIVRTSESSDVMCDDGLSQQELDMICGVYHCFTEQRSQYGSRSWWPTDSCWQTNAQHTRWTEKSDKFFKDRLLKLQAGTEEPLRTKEWRNQIRGSSSIRAVNNFVSSSFQNFISSNLQT